MVAKRSPEKPSIDLPSTKKLKVEGDVVGKDTEKSKSKKKNESILINPGMKSVVLPQYLSELIWSHFVAKISFLDACIISLSEVPSGCMPIFPLHKHISP